VLDQHPQTPTTPVPITRREAIAAERATTTRTTTSPRARVRTPRAAPPPRITRVQRAAPPAAIPSPRRGRSFRARTLQAIPLTGAAAAMALFGAAALPAQVTTGTAAALPGVTTPAAQHYAVATGTTITINRDGYTVTKPAPKPVTPTVTTKTATANTTGAATSTAATGTIVNTGAGDIRWPVAGAIRISSPFGARTSPCATCSSQHQGVDITPGAGTPIGAVAAGTVRVSSTHPEYGQYVIIDHQIDGQLVSTLYAHMIYGSAPLRPGQTVAVGQLVGLVGSTGASTGAHLHLQVMPGGTTPIDPIAWLTTNAGRTL